MAWQAARRRRELDRGRERGRGRRRREQGRKRRRWVPEKLAEAEAAAAGETEAEEAMGGARDSGGRWLNGGAEAQEVGVDEGKALVEIGRAHV